MSDTPAIAGFRVVSQDAWEAGLAACEEYRSKLDKLERELTVANNWVEHHQNHCDDLIKENARLRMELDASCNAEELRQVRDENAALRAELEAQAVVNGKGSEREAKLLAEVVALRKDKERLDFLETQCEFQLSWSDDSVTDPKVMTSVRSAIDASMKEAQP